MSRVNYMSMIVSISVAMSTLLALNLSCHLGPNSNSDKAKKQQSKNTNTAIETADDGTFEPGDPTISMPAGNPENEAIQMSVELEVARNEEMSPIPQFGPLLHTGGKTFFVWVDPNNRPQVSQKINGKVDVHPLDENDDYAVKSDSHHGFSIGIDRDGYLHVMGDMHHYPMTIQRTPNMPARYIEQNSMYWISQQPYDVTAGFRFAGASDSPSAIPGESLSYPKFYHAPNGDLYLSLLVRAHINPSTAEKSFAPGAMGLGVYRYDPMTKAWDALGGYPDVELDDDGSMWKVLFWEKAGTNVWFQGFIPGISFDGQGNMHLAAAGNIDSTMSGGTFVFYAMSPDRGKTWQRANGSSIPSLPLRGVASSPSRADVVLDTKGELFLDDLTRVAVDHQGMPLVWNHDVWRRWDGQRWNDDVNPGKDSIGYEVMLGPDNVLTFVGAYYRMARAAASDSKRVVHSYESITGLSTEGPLTSPSDVGLRTTGAVFAVDQGDKNTLRVVKMQFTPN